MSKNEKTSTIKGIMLQLDRTNPREKQIIDKLEFEKAKGINIKETVIRALESNNNDVLREIRELKLLIIKLHVNGITPQQKIEVENKLKEIESLNDDIELDCKI